MIYSDQMTLTLFFSLFLIFCYFLIVFKKSSIARVRYWRRQIPITVLVNAIGFTSIALLFYFSYGAITDDRTFFDQSIGYKGNLFTTRNGSEFMFLLSKPFRKYFNFDLPSFHAFFGAMGYIACLNFLFVLSNVVDFKAKSDKKMNTIKLWAILCFPNFMVWGRIYGKDSTILFLSSICVVCCYYIFEKKKNILINLTLFAMGVFLVSRIRIHIAIALSIGLFAGLYFLSIAKKRYSSFNQHLLMQLIIPVIILSSFLTIAPFIIKKATSQDTLSIDAIQNSLMNATRMGAYGGSATALASEFKEDPKVVLTPKQIAINIFNLLFAPMPWQIRGFLDLVALASNILLLFLILKFTKRVDITSIFQKYLFISTISLIVLLSFLTGNVGLILRQKTILLPFLFLFLFRSKPSGSTIKRISGQTLPRAPVPSIQA